MEVVICFDWGGKVFGGELGCLGGGSGLFGWGKWVVWVVG